MGEEMIHSEETSETLCPLPFLHTYVKANGKLVACCEAQETVLSTDLGGLEDWNSSSYRALRSEMLNGEKPSICRKCWKNEAVGSPSAREQAWTDFRAGFYSTDTIASSMEGEVSRAPSFVEVKCSNFCNLKCKMCHPSSSSRLNEDREIHAKYQPDLVWPKVPVRSDQTIHELLSFKSEDLKDLRVLQFSGGEPFLHAQQYEIVSRLSGKHSADISLRYATNLTTFPSRELLGQWSRFRAVNVKVSLDGIDDVNDYIRLGSRFSEVISNLRRLEQEKSANVSLGVGFTAQAYNIFQIHEFLDYFKDLSFNGFVATHLLHFPRHLSIVVYPPRIRERLIEYLSSGSNPKQVNDKIQWLRTEPFDGHQWRQFLEFTRDFEAKYNVSGRLKMFLTRAFGSEIGDFLQNEMSKQGIGA